MSGLCIDHVDASGGNAATNLVTSCFACNRAKQAVAEDLNELAQRIATRQRSAATILKAVAQQQATPLTVHTRAVARSLDTEKPGWLTDIRRMSDAKERKIPF